MIPITIDVTYVDGHWLIGDPFCVNGVVRDTFPQAVQAIGSLMMQKGCGVDLTNIKCVVNGCPAETQTGGQGV